MRLVRRRLSIKIRIRKRLMYLM